VARPDDTRFMRLAVRLARRGVGRSSPNPPVGAVVVARGRVVGRGYHRRAGGPHAEAEALRAAGARARGATVYVTLEPCAHHGRTPPCTEALLAAGVRRVVFGSRDPNPTVAGNGARRLQRAGVAVSGGLLQPACDELIAAFRKHVTTGLPLVTLKLAATLDGRIATATGESRWITAADSRRYVHRLRAAHDAVLVGANTVRHDDPELTCRLRGGRNPLRVVLDGRLRVPLRARVLAPTRTAPTLVVAGRGVSRAKVERVRRRGVEVMLLPDRQGRVSMARLFRTLGSRGIMSVLVEGGADVAAAALAAHAVDRLLCFYAPRLIGGDGHPMLGPLGVRRLRAAPRLGRVQIRRFASDVLLATDVLGGGDRGAH
jgi:diaminohydroxyphosphoribosylaminopyrimidine deaminase/5-amino-6-(5-phosphoribosylamino)uracil reductase